MTLSVPPHDPGAAHPQDAAEPPPLKVLHIAQTLPGGIISYLEELLPTQIARFGQDNVMALVARQDRPLLKMLPDRCVHTFRDGRRKLSALFDFALRAWQVIDSARPDVVHLHSSFAGLLRPLIALVPRHRRPAVVYCAHGWAFNMRTALWKRAFYAFVERQLSRLNAQIVCISNFEYASALARKLVPQRIALIENAIDRSPPSLPPPPFDRDQDKLNLLFIGRFDTQKGFDIAEAAMDLLKDAPVVLHAVGASVLSDGVSTPYRRAPARNIVHHGWQDRSAVYGFIEQADVILIPSRWEGFGIVAIEAMRQGKPVIASAVDALPEIVSHGRTGILVPPEDPKSLATAILNLDQESLAAMGQQGRCRFLERFTSERLNDEIIAAYHRAIALRQSPAPQEMPPYPLNPAQP